MTLILVLIYLTGGMEKFSLIYYDFYYYLRGNISPDPKVALVVLDDESLEHFKIRLSDWPRSLHASLIKNLDIAGAELIVLDYDFSKPTKPEEDKALARAIKEAGSVILTNRLIPGGEIIHPLPAFAENALDEGFINFDPDIDGYWRRLLYLAKDKEDYLYFSLALKVIEIYEDFPEEERDIFREDYLRWGPYKLPLPYLHINFAGPSGSIPALSYYKVINGDIPPNWAKGKIILVGITSGLGKDYFPSPTAKLMSGIEIHANTVSSILNRSFITPLSRSWTLVLIIGPGILVALLFALPKITIQLNLLITFAVLIFFISTGYYLFVHKFIWLDVVPMFLVVMGNSISGGMYQFAVARKRNIMITEVLGRYISKNVAETILADEVPIQMDGHRTELTVLFSDIRGFTNLSEKLAPGEVSEFLNKYFEEMIQAVFDSNGTLDKLMGDAVMAFFGAPLHFPDHPEKACRCAIKMLSALEEMKKKGEVKNIDKINIGIGINTGDVIVGNLGSSKFIDYTVIGDTVNLGSRLEGLNKEYGTAVIISESTFARVKGAFHCRELDLVTVKGKTKPIKVYEIIGEKEKEWKNTPNFIKDFQEGLCLYRDRNWKEAVHSFQSVLTSRPGDGPAGLYIRRCKEFLTRPPGGNWTGVYERRTK